MSNRFGLPTMRIFPTDPLFTVFRDGSRVLCGAARYLGVGESMTVTILNVVVNGVSHPQKKKMKTNFLVLAPI